MQLKLNSVNTIYVKQQHNIDVFIFKFTLKHMPGIIKYMPGNVIIT